MDVHDHIAHCPTTASTRRHQVVIVESFDHIQEGAEPVEEPDLPGGMFDVQRRLLTCMGKPDSLAQRSASRRDRLMDVGFGHAIRHLTPPGRR